MIVSSLRQTIYPNEMGDIFKANGLRALTGTDPKAFEWIAKKYDLKVKKTLYIADAVECLKRGGMVISYCKAKSLFGDGGHIIVLSEIRGDNLVVFDPNLYYNKFNIIYGGVDRRKGQVKVNGVEAILTVANFKKYCDYTLYCYEPPVTIQPSKYQNGEWIEINVPVTLTGSAEASNIGGNDLQVDDMKGTINSQYWVHESIVKNGHIIARAQIAWASGKDYLVQVFNRQFWIEEKNILKKL